MVTEVISNKARMERRLSISLLIFVINVPLLRSTPLNIDITVSIPEELEVGHEVTKISSEDRGSIYVADNKLNIDYQFFSSSTTEKYFSLNSKTGRITIRRKIDRDNMCSSVSTCCPNKPRSDGRCIFPLSVRSDIEYHYVYSIKVMITDINDNSPRWAQSEITAQFPESSTIGEYRTISTAIDADSGLNTVQDYRVDPQLPEFELEYIRDLSNNGMGSGTGGELRLKLERQLDRETTSSYEFTLYAEDRGNPKRTGSVKVRVVVTDENDNKPKFDQKVYTGTIPENTESNTKVLKVSATDRDEGAYGSVEFHISSHTAPEVRRLFSIETQTGLIRVQGSIDYEQIKAVKLLIEASDRGVTPRTSLATVELKITDKNDNPPVVHLQSSTGNAPRHHNLAEIEENKPVGTLVAAFSVDDRDSGANGKVLCQLADNSYFGLRSMNIPDTVMYRLQTATILDREEVPLHRVAIICEDEGDHPLTSTTTISVSVLDQNDESPRFNPEHYFENVREDLEIDSHVFTLNASDKDDGNNGLLNYWISTDKHVPFKVQKLSGKVLLKEPLDRETVDRLTFVVYAKDFGNPQRTGSATVSVSVTDANDNDPQLAPLYYFSVLENETAGTRIGFINATDKDEDKNGQLTYILQSETGGRVKYFHITNNGEILVMHSGLDRERQAIHKFTVRVHDNGIPRRTSTSIVTVTILDVNDCYPTFIFPNNSNDTIYVSHRARSGDLIGRVQVTDDDSGPNKELVYSMKKNTRDSEIFQLDPVSGELRLDRELTPDDFRQMHLVITAKDRGKPPLSRMQVLKVKIQRPNIEDTNREQTPRKAHTDILGQNLVVIIALVGVTAVFVLVLISAILILSCKRRRHLRERHSSDMPPPEVNWDQKTPHNTLTLKSHDQKWMESKHGFHTELSDAARDLTHLAVGGDGSSMISSVDPSNDSGKGGSLDANMHTSGRDETVYQALSKFNTNYRNPNLNTTDDVKRSLKHQYESLVQEDEAEYDPKSVIHVQQATKLFDDRLSPIEESNSTQPRSFNNREMEYIYNSQSSTLKKKNPYQPVIGASFV